METKETDYPDLPPGYELPPGMVFHRKGGRPKKEARDAAVFLAHFWRKEKFSERPAHAERWIVERWNLKGVTEGAHVRAAIKRARKHGLNQGFLLIAENGMCFGAEVNKNALGEREFKLGGRVWVWVEGMTEAMQCEITNIEEGEYPYP
jgi:hypothetical protein